MRLACKLWLAAWALCFAQTTLAVSSLRPGTLRSSRASSSSDLISWDEHSLFIRGERIMVFSGEFHPFRLPSPGLWIDVFQKIKAMGFSAVSFYVDWSLVEGTEGVVRTDGVFSLEQFFSSAAEAGIYLLARPGPYINAETAAGGFPGWLLRDPAVLRSYDQRYLSKTQNYISHISKIISAAEITNGGPVVMLQPENEYTTWNGTLIGFPFLMNQEYMAYVENQYREAGITVPFFVNDNEVRGDFSPTSGEIGALKYGVYGIDAYPLYYDCGTPYYWPNLRFPTNWQALHRQQSPTTPFMIAEFQGGSGDGWGGVGEDMCAVFINDQAVRVLFKNNYSFGATLFNVYMIYGGTNWGNLGFEGGYTSYDYGAAITEDRHVWREKYSEMKLEANFLKVSPAYLTAVSNNVTNGTLASTTAIAFTKLADSQSDTNFYVVRHADWTSSANTTFTFSMPTSIGNVTLPQVGGKLALYGRDSKIMVSDYRIGDINLIYCTADIFTWANTATGKILIVYGEAGEVHEMALPTSMGEYHMLLSTRTTVKKVESIYIIHWQVTPERQVINVGTLQIHLLWRNDAFNHWVMELPAPAPIGNYTSPSKSLAVIKAGYLVRTARIYGNELQVTGDFNETTTLEVIAVPEEVQKLAVNGKDVKASRSSLGNVQGTVSFTPPSVGLPSFATSTWKAIDSLPEVRSTYDDSHWISGDHKTTTNNQRNLTTPTSLYASDYGFHAGSLIYRGHFISNGTEQSFYLLSSGGTGFGHSVWLNGTYLGSWKGSGSNNTANQTLTFPQSLARGRHYVLTILIDHMGQTEEGPGSDAIKFPYGVLDYSLNGHEKSDVTWKLTGNLGGENYQDLVRGPRNEGAMFAERQGYHLPKPPNQQWESSNPISDGLNSPGVKLYTFEFDLSTPVGYDVPISFVFTQTNSSGNLPNYRCQLFVNGYQFGKYVNNLGPETAFPVPEGILNHHGTNYLALTLWAQDTEGARLAGLSLEPQMPVLSGYQVPALAPMSSYIPRKGAY